MAFLIPNSAYNLWLFDNFNSLRYRPFSQQTVFVVKQILFRPSPANFLQTFMLIAVRMIDAHIAGFNFFSFNHPLRRQKCPAPQQCRGLYFKSGYGIIVFFMHYCTYRYPLI